MPIEEKRGSRPVVLRSTNQLRLRLGRVFNDPAELTDLRVHQTVSLNLQVRVLLVAKRTQDFRAGSRR